MQVGGCVVNSFKIAIETIRRIRGLDEVQTDTTVVIGNPRSFD